MNFEIEYRKMINHIFGPILSGTVSIPSASSNRYGTMACGTWHAGPPCKRRLEPTTTTHPPPLPPSPSTSYSLLKRVHVASTIGITIRILFRDRVRVTIARSRHAPPTAQCTACLPHHARSLHPIPLGSHFWRACAGFRGLARSPASAACARHRRVHHPRP